MSRNSALRGNIIELTAIFSDAANQPADPENLKVSIYPPGYNPESGAVPGDAWVYEATLTSGGSGPESDPSRTVEKSDTGSYKFAFPIPADADLGAAFDRWEATLDGEDLDETFSFVIVGGGSVGTTKLYDNNIVYTELDKSIAALDGSTLGEDQTFYFTTTYDPLYASVRQVRLDCGPLLVDVPDDTINFAIFEASLEADANSFKSVISDASYYKYIRNQYTLLNAELTLIGALMGDIGLSSRMSKTLGDLSVSRGGLNSSLQYKRDQLQDELQELLKVIRSGGLIAPGASLNSKYGIKGNAAEDSMFVQRQWQPTSGIGANTRSAGNTSVYSSGRRRLKTYRDVF